MLNKILSLLDNVTAKALGVVGSPSSSFEVIIDIRDVSEKGKLLGELACFHVDEDDNEIFVLGQITEIKTINRWHEEPSFKGIIKKKGKLPNLSGDADNRIAKINVQSSFMLPKANSPEAHKLANSPSTGIQVQKVTNEIMQELMTDKEGLVCLGTAYDTDVKVPFWLKHFGKPKDGGAGEAYHIGVFGRSGSGKTTAAANMLLGYARHNEHMSILVLDPQEQFYEDNDVLPEGEFEEKVTNLGMDYKKYKMPEHISLPNNASLFSQILLEYGFVRKAFNIHTQNKRELMAESIQEYMEGRIEHDSKFSIGATDPATLLESMIKRFHEKEKYLKNVYAEGGGRLSGLKEKIRRALNNDINKEAVDIWKNVCSLFKENDQRMKLEALIDEVVCNPKSFIVLNISDRNATAGMESLQTLFIKIVEDEIRKKGAERYAKGMKSNCLIVMDEAHRFISTSSYETETKELTTSIIDSVRTTRKYGIGYMFITQTIESLHTEIRQQIRIFAFGYGLTSGGELSKIRDIINDDTSTKFYRAFIDPASNRKFPFMFYGPISPLSFTGMPLFLEMQKELSDFPVNKSENVPNQGNGDSDKNSSNSQ